MRKKLLVAAAFVIAALGANAQTLYSSGKIAPNFDYELPDFITGIECEAFTREIVGENINKISGEFGEILGVAEKTALLRAIRIGRTGNLDTENGEVAGHAKLTLPSCHSIELYCWGTGGRGIEIRKDAVDGEVLAWNGNNSYTAIKVTASPNIQEPVTIYLVPTGKVQSEGATGDTYISELTITGTGTVGINDLDLDKKVIAVEYYSVTGLKFESAQQGLNIVKTTYEDGSIKTTKAFIK